MDFNIGYLISSVSGSGAYLGVLLVTDYKGMALDLTYTEPILPTKLQEIVHGDYLNKYLKIEVIFKGLYRAVNSPLSFVVVSDKEFLINDVTEIPTIHISTAQSMPLTEVGEVVVVNDHEYLIQTTDASSPNRVILPSRLKHSDKLVQELNEKIIYAGKNIDITEPIKRAEEALEEIYKQKIGSRK